MSESLAKKILKINGIIYYVLTVFLVALAIFSFVSSDNELITKLVDTLKINSEGVNPSTVLGISLLLMAVLEFFLGWLCCRATKDGSKTTLLMVLTALNVISSISALITGSVETITSGIVSLAIDCAVFASVMTVRKSAK